MSTQSTSLSRPAGYAPRGTSAGIVGYTLLSVAVPFIALEGLIPVLANGLDVWLGSILPVIGFAMVLLLVLALGLHKRRYWYVCYLFATGALLLVGYLLGLLTGLAILTHLVPVRHSDLRFASVVNLVFWLLLAPFAWLLLRMLRLRYWQPWTRAAEWEPGDEAPPRWGMSSDRPKP